MKTLSNYIKESMDKSQNSKNGHFEEFVDEETGELVTLWIEDKPEEIVKAVKETTPEELQKLKEIRPRTVAQAIRISGVNPSDISILLVYLRKYYNE